MQREAQLLASPKSSDEASVGFVERRPLLDRFWEKVDTRHESGCWLWMGARDRYGYGQIKVGGRRGKVVYAHRLSYENHVGPIPPGQDVDHRYTCVSKLCVNFNHLRPTTRKQNLENLSGARRDSKSGVRGVHWDERCKRWSGFVGHHGKSYFVGRFVDMDEAEAAVIAKRNELFTHNDRDRA